MTVAVVLLESVGLFQLGALAFFVWLAVSRDRAWAWLPAAYFGFQVTQGMLGGEGGSIVFPLMVLAAGVLLLSRGRLNRPARIGILVLLAVLGVAAADRETAKSLGAESSDTAQADAIEDEELDLPALRGRPVVIESADADLAVSKSRTGSLAVPLDIDYLEVVEHDTFILIAVDDDGPIDIRVPAEARVSIRTQSADVSVMVDAFSVSVDTLSGDIEARLRGPHPVRAETFGGSIEAPNLNDEDPSPSVFNISASGTPVSLKSIGGSVVIDEI